MSWDILIAPHKRPLEPVVPYWLAHEAPWDDYRPTKEQCVWAKAYNRRRLLSLGFRGWLTGVMERKATMLGCVRKLLIETQKRKTHVARTIIRAWKAWAQAQNNARMLAFADLDRKTTHNLVSAVFRAWLAHTKKAIETRKWFEKMSQMEEEDEDNVAQAGDLFTKLAWSSRVLIFQMLDVKDLCRCAQVCRSWQDVTQDPLIWGFVDFSPLGKCTNDEVVSYLVQRHRATITNLNLRSCIKISYEACSRLGECRNLQELNLAGCTTVMDSGIRDIVHGCQSLLFLNLAMCRITDLSLLYLATYGHSLEYLSLAYCDDLTDAGALSLASGTGCRRLLHLDLSGCRNFSSEGFVHLISACGAELKSLMLRHLSTLKSVVIFAVTETCRRLERINMEGCTKISDKALRGFARCGELKSLTISNNKIITGNGVKGVTRALKRLKEVAISNCGSVGTEGFAAFGANPVAKMDFSSCTMLRDAGLVKLVESGSTLRKHLTTLDLSSCNGVSDAGFQAIGSRLSNLTTLILRDCPGLGDASFERLADLDQLEYLDVSGCANFGAEGMQFFGSSDRSALEHVDFTNCVGMDDLAMQGFAKGCSALMSVRVAGCTELTDEALYHITFSNRYLGLLDLQDCSLLTDKAIHCLGSCPAIASLNIFGVPLITGPTVEKHIGQLRNLQSLAVMEGARISKQVIQHLQHLRGARLAIHYDNIPPEFF